ncbi:FKBP12-interacting protein of 37 kDa-like [Arachis hypogaea]|uniref:FKBP12-interacting protein of 37 kDa-like n=1 Tax=Arachis hypogaea TaxID=3818 RepID=UPI0010FC453B|nr:FKBP12-interacting protein of 37 kDa-like [Arachis hypogaea]
MRYLLHLSIVTINNISLCLTLLFPFILSNLVIDSLQNCKDTLATCQNELEAAKSEIQSWHSSIQNEPCVPAGATPEPKMLLDYLQALKSSEESLREQLEKAKKKEAAFIVTFAKREQEIAELKVSCSK